MTKAMVLSMATLPRVELPKVDFSSAIAVANKAMKQLRYEAAFNDIQNLKLLGILARLNVMPFTQEAVATYKAQQQKKARKGTWNPLRRHDIRWRLTRMSDYSGVVPLSVLDTANQVFEATHQEFNGISNVLFSVEYLADKDMEVERPEVYDPFLCVNVVNGPRHRIAVWDEPTFKY